MLRLAELTNHSDQMCIILMGGEPLLHPQVGEFCRVTRECYPEAGITIITNGTLIPKMGKALRKVRPQPPYYTWLDVDGCWFCKKVNACGGCKIMKNFVAE